jgi:hypothetical protein
MAPKFNVGDRVVFKKHMDKNIRLRVFVVRDRMGPLPRFIYMLSVDWTRNVNVVNCLSRNWIEEKDLELAPVPAWDSEGI